MYNEIVTLLQKNENLIIQAVHFEIKLELSLNGNVANLPTSPYMQQLAKTKGELCVFWKNAAANSSENEMMWDRQKLVSNLDFIILLDCFEAYALQKNLCLRVAISITLDNGFHQIFLKNKRHYVYLRSTNMAHEFYCPIGPSPIPNPPSNPQALPEHSQKMIPFSVNSPPLAHLRPGSSGNEECESTKTPASTGITTVPKTSDEGKKNGPYSQFHIYTMDGHFAKMPINPSTAPSTSGSEANGKKQKKRVGNISPSNIATITTAAAGGAGAMPLLRGFQPYMSNQYPPALLLPGQQFFSQQKQNQPLQKQSPTPASLQNQPSTTNKHPPIDTEQNAFEKTGIPLNARIQRALSLSPPDSTTTTTTTSSSSFTMPNKSLQPPPIPVPPPPSDLPGQMPILDSSCPAHLLLFPTPVPKDQKENRRKQQVAGALFDDSSRKVPEMERPRKESTADHSATLRELKKNSGGNLAGCETAPADDCGKDDLVVCKISITEPAPLQKYEARHTMTEITVESDPLDWERDDRSRTSSLARSSGEAGAALAAHGAAFQIEAFHSVHGGSPVGEVGAKAPLSTDADPKTRAPQAQDSTGNFSHDADTEVDDEEVLEENGNFNCKDDDGSSTDDDDVIMEDAVPISEERQEVVVNVHNYSELKQMDLVPVGGPASCSPALVLPKRFNPQFLSAIFIYDLKKSDEISSDMAFLFKIIVCRSIPGSTGPHLIFHLLANDMKETKWIFTNTTDFDHYVALVASGTNPATLGSKEHLFFKDRFLSYHSGAYLFKSGAANYNVLVELQKLAKSTHLPMDDFILNAMTNNTSLAYAAKNNIPMKKNAYDATPLRPVFVGHLPKP